MDDAQNLQVQEQMDLNNNDAGGDEGRPTITSDQLTEFVKFIVENIVTSKEEVEVAVMEDVPGSFTVHIKVAADDKGRVIGKKGNTINAIRSLVRVFGKIIVLLQD